MEQVAEAGLCCRSHKEGRVHNLRFCWFSGLYPNLNDWAKGRGASGRFVDEIDVARLHKDGLIGGCRWAEICPRKWVTDPKLGIKITECLHRIGPLEDDGGAVLVEVYRTAEEVV